MLGLGLAVAQVAVRRLPAIVLPPTPTHELLPPAIELSEADDATSVAFLITLQFDELLPDTGYEGFRLRFERATDAQFATGYVTETHEITAGEPGAVIDAGTLDVALVNGLEPGTSYWFAVTVLPPAGSQAFSASTPTVQAFDLPAFVTVEHLRSNVTHLDYGIETAPIAGPAIAVEPGDKIVLHLSILSTTHPGTVTGVSADFESGAVPFGFIGTTDAGYYRKAQAWFLDVTEAGDLPTITLTATAGPNKFVAAHILRVQGAGAGGPGQQGSYFETRVGAAGTEHDVDGGLSADVLGALLVSVGNFGAALDFTGAAEIGEAVDAANNLASAIALQTEPASVTVATPANQDLCIAVTKWNAP